MRNQLAIFISLMLILASCDGTDEQNMRSGNTLDDADAVAETNQTPPHVEPTPTNEPKPEVEIIEKTEVTEVEEFTTVYTAPDRTGEKNVAQDNSQSPVMMQNANQLRNSIATCIGADMTAVQTESVVTLGEERSADAFLLPLLYAPGDDIIARNRTALDGPAAALGTGTRQNMLSVEYLTALRSIANVVAHNCSLLGSGFAECSCDTTIAAQEMLSRCLPQYPVSSEDSAELIETFRASCSMDQRGAIAALLSSLGFAATP